MKYNIRINYETGDTFSSHDEIDYLDGTWENEEIIRENLSRIKEHYEWIKDKHGYNPKIEEPEWHKRCPYENTVILKTDLGIEYWQSSFWSGYFETLYEAKAIPIKPEIEIGFSI